MRRLRGAWAVLMGRAQAIVVEHEERPPAFFDERDLAAIDTANIPNRQKD